MMFWYSASDFTTRGLHKDITRLSRRPEIKEIVMFAEDLLQFRNDLYNWGVLFCYSGYLNEAVLESIGTAMRVKLENDTSDPRLARTLFSVFVEQVQNVVRYSAEV